MTVRPCWGCLELDTPATIKAEGNEHYPANTDIFAEVMDTVTGTFVNGELMHKALWWRYRNHIIGACETPDWVQGMADRLDLVGPRWDAILSKLAEVSADMTDLTDMSYERLIKHEPIEDTDGDVRTVKYEHETLPQTETTDTKYLDSRSGNTDTYAPNTKDTETYRENNTLTAETFASMVRNYPNVLVDFTDEFSEYFVDRWY